MKACDLIAELQRFGPDARVAVEVEADVGRRLWGPDDDSILVAIERVVPESQERYEVKLILER